MLLFQFMDLEMKYMSEWIRKNFRVIFQTSKVFIMIFRSLKINKIYIILRLG